MCILACDRDSISLINYNEMLASRLGSSMEGHCRLFFTRLHELYQIMHMLKLDCTQMPT
jgi:hypothetical protein